MAEYKYVIVGGGMTADAAVAGIRQEDPEGAVGVFSAETHPPYNRPPLTKGLWKGKPYEKIFRKGIEQPGVSLHLGRAIQRLDPAAHQVVDDQGLEHRYEKLLLATGGTPRRLPFGGDEVIYFRSLDDYHHLHDLVEQGRRFGVIGGGFIGSEVAAILAMKNQPVTMLFPEEAIGSRLFPKELAHFINKYYREKGVQVLDGELVAGIERQGDELVIRTKSGKEVRVDSVVAGLGIRPNTALAEAAGIEVADGVVVDERLHTSQPDIFAAGDVAYFHNLPLGTRMRVEHEDNALTMGRAAGRNMAGEPVVYNHLPMFYSDLFDLGYEAVGEMNPELETYADWQEPNRKGVIYYLKDGRVRGVLLWDVWEQVEAARRLIAEPGPFTAAELKGRIEG